MPVAKPRPSSGSSPVSFTVLRSVNDAPEAWDQAAPPDNLFLQRPYLTALETSPPKGMGFRYAIVYLDGRPWGVVYAQLLDFQGAESLRYAPSSTYPACFFSTFGQFLRGLVARQVEFTSLVCGNLMLSGEHGFAIPEGTVPIAEVVDQAVRLMRQDAEAEGIDVSVVLLKDFYPERPEGQRGFQAKEFHAFCIQPSMVMTLDPAWAGFQDYLDALSSKYRVRAKKARKLLARQVTRKLLTAEDVRSSQHGIYALYREIADDSGFNVISLSEDYFTSLHAQMDGNMVVQGYFENGTLIGFITGILNTNGDLEAHFLGYDQDRNPGYKLYLNMLLDLVDLGIARGARRVVFARTAEEIKSSVGAVAVPLVCYIRHRSRFVNRFIRPLLDYLNPVDDWIPRHPFKRAESEVSQPA